MKLYDYPLYLDSEYRRYSGVRSNMSLVVDGFRCKRSDGTIKEADLATDLVMDGEAYESVKSFCKQQLESEIDA